MDSLRFKLIADGNSKGTKNKYSYPIALYHQFCEQYNLPIVPATKALCHTQLERYLTYRVEFAEGTDATVQSDVDAIQNYWANFGQSADGRKHRPIKNIFRSAATRRPKANHTSRPLHMWEIKGILSKLNTNFIDDAVLYAVWTFAYTTGLRVHEFLAHNNSINTSIDSKKLYLRYDRIYINNTPGKKHWAMAWYWHSKNNQTLTRQEVTLPCFCNQGLCAVAALEHLISKIKNIQPSTAIFTWANGKFVTSDDARKCLQNACLSIGSVADHISNHSWRKSCITQAIRQGMPDSLIVQLADWKSFESCRPYINLNPRDLIDVREQYANTFMGSTKPKRNRKDTRFRNFVRKTKYARRARL